MAEMSNKYMIVDDFQAGPTDIRVLVLDRDYEFSESLTRSRALLTVGNTSSTLTPSAAGQRSRVTTALREKRWSLCDAVTRN